MIKKKAAESKGCWGDISRQHHFDMINSLSYYSKMQSVSETSNVRVNSDFFLFPKLVFQWQCFTHTARNFSSTDQTM